MKITVKNQNTAKMLLIVVMKKKKKRSRGENKRKNIKNS
jgi:hypothetical protein